MKKLLIIVVAFLVGVAANPLYAQKKNTEKKKTEVARFKSNMDCAECEQTISNYLKFEKGVKKLEIDHASNTIVVEYKQGKNSDEKLAKAIEKTGYKAQKITEKEYITLVSSASKTHEHGTEQHKTRSKN